MVAQGIAAPAQTERVATMACAKLGNASPIAPENSAGTMDVGRSAVLVDKELCAWRANAHPSPLCTQVFLM